MLKKAQWDRGISLHIRNTGMTKAGNMTIHMLHLEPSLGKKATIHQVTTMPVTSKNVLFSGHNHLLTTSTDDLPFNYHPCWYLCDNQSVRSSVPVVSRWLWPGSRTFLEVASMVVTGWVVANLCSELWLPLLMLQHCLLAPSCLNVVIAATTAFVVFLFPTEKTRRKAASKYRKLSDSYYSVAFSV